METSGDTDLVGLLDLLQIFELNRRSVCVEIAKDEREVLLILEDGKIVYAKIEDLSGEDAFNKILNWKGTKFKIFTEPESVEPNITKKNSEIFFEAITNNLGMAKPARGEGWEFCGDLQIISTLELLQIFSSNCQNVEISIKADDREGKIFIIDSTLLDAFFKEEKGYDALYKIFEIASGTFKVKPLKKTHKKRINEPILEVLQKFFSSTETGMLKGREELASKIMVDLNEGNLSQKTKIAIAERFFPQGDLAPVSIILKLASDDDKMVADKAFDTIISLPEILIRSIASNEETPRSVLSKLIDVMHDEYFVIKSLLSNNKLDDELLAKLAPVAKLSILEEIMQDKERVESSVELRKAIEKNPLYFKLKEGMSKTEIIKYDKVEEEPTKIRRRSIASLGLKDKLFLAERGNENQKLILASDTSDTVALAVINSSSIGELLIEKIANLSTVNPIVLETIGSDPRWKNIYPIAKALAFNVKTPLKEARDALRFLRESDLRRISRNKELPGGLRAVAGRLLKARSTRRM